MLLAYPCFSGLFVVQFVLLQSSYTSSQLSSLQINVCDCLNIGATSMNRQNTDLLNILSCANSHYSTLCTNLSVQIEPIQHINHFLTLRSKLQLQFQTKTSQQSSTACICGFLHCSRMLLAEKIETAQFKSFGSQSMKGLQSAVPVFEPG